MSGRKTSVDDGGAHAGPSQVSSRSRMQLALLKLSTANAFAKALSASHSAKKAETSWVTRSQEATLSTHGFAGSILYPDDGLAPSADCGPPLCPLLHSPYFGMYSDYEDVMQLLHNAVIADGNSMHLLAQVAPEQVVHVAHLGIGACCSVDLVALHCADGSRLLAAAKSCYLPPSDPRLRASLREADLLRRCKECPFIMQLLTVLYCSDLDAAASADAAANGTSSPLNIVPTQTSLVRTSGELGHGSGGGGGGSLGSIQSMSPGSMTMSADFNTDMMTRMMTSPGYQAWAQWRGGGSADDVERQLRQRMSAAMAVEAAGRHSISSGGGWFDMDGPGGISESFSLGVNYISGDGGWGGGAGAVLAAMQQASTTNSVQSSLGGWDAGGASYGIGMTTLDDPMMSSFGDVCGGGGARCGNIGDGAAAYGGRYGGGWAGGSGATMGGSLPRLKRRASMEILNMYGGCTAMGGSSDAPSGAQGADVMGGTVAVGEPPVMCTLLLGWARCGDLRRLAQLLLGKSAAHQNNKITGAAAVVGGLPPLVPEDAARFYVGCVVLALEHLHCRLSTVHRDLKLSNLLLLDNGYVVIGDLGTAVDLSTVQGGRLNSRVGSPGHMAPECRDRDKAGYDTAADMWSLGACLFSLMTGQLPAGVTGPPHPQWSPPLSRHWSRALQDLLGRLLSWAPAQRLTATQMMRDPWFRGFDWRALREQKMLPPSNTPWRELLWWPKENRQLL